MPKYFDATRLGFLNNTWLGNDYHAAFIIDGVEFPTVSSFIGMQKTMTFENKDDLEYWRAYLVPSCFSRLNGIGTKLTTKLDMNSRYETWLHVQLDLMMQALRAKFEQHPMLRESLMRTGKLQLVYCSSNSFWGTGTGLAFSKQFYGHNKLGRYLMEIRSEFMNDFEVKYGRVLESKEREYEFIDPQSMDHFSVIKTKQHCNQILFM